MVPRRTGRCPIAPRADIERRTAYAWGYLLEVVSMPKVDTRVQIDAAVLERVDSVAAALGSSRDQVIEELRTAQPRLACAA